MTFMRLFLFSCFAFLTHFIVVPHSAAEDIVIDIGQAQVKKSLLAMPPLSYMGSSGTNRTHMAAGKDLFETISNDLMASSYFQSINPDAFLEDTSKVGLKPAPGAANGFDFKKWTTIGTEFLIRGGYNVIGSKLSLEIYLYHVPKANLVIGKTYESDLNQAKKVAHTFANDAIKALTGKQAFFLTRIVATGRTNFKAAKEIYLMDWDGDNVQKISNHKSIAVSPSWSPDGKKIAYTAFAFHKNIKSRNSDLLVYDIQSKRRQLISYRLGINSGASFFPSGDDLLLTISQAGNPDLYRMDLSGGSLRRLTNGPNRAMNVEAAVSPDGKQIAFSSDRSGKPMLYVMSATGGAARRLTFAGVYNSTPSWSPDGKKLTFASFDKGHFDVFIINPDGTGLKRLTSATKANGRKADNRDPSFSPDGRQIVFTSNRTGHRQLYMVDPEGTTERRLTNDTMEWEQPRWSPFLD